MTDPHRDYPTPLETIAALEQALDFRTKIIAGQTAALEEVGKVNAALEARCNKLELVCAQKSARCTEAVRDMSLAKAENARLRELLRECAGIVEYHRDLYDRINAELAKGE